MENVIFSFRTAVDDRLDDPFLMYSLLYYFSWTVVWLPLWSLLPLLLLLLGRLIRDADSIVGTLLLLRSTNPHFLLLLVSLPSEGVGCWGGGQTVKLFAICAG